jgi:membrane associated rhomboid family serine protease
VIPLWDNVPTRRFPIVTLSLIVANLGVWLWELNAQNDVADYAYYPCSVWGPCFGPAIEHLPWWQGPFSSMFLHASWVHVLGNLLFLWIFGNNVEDTFGRVRFLVFYLVAGYAATAAQTLVTLGFADAAEASVPNVGASGAIAGVLGAYLILFPTAMVLTLVGIFPLPVPAFLFLGVWFVFQLWQGGFSVTHPASGGGVAFFAHLGGFAVGVVTVLAFGVRRRRMRALPA